MIVEGNVVWTRDDTTWKSLSTFLIPALGDNATDCFVGGNWSTVRAAQRPLHPPTARRSFNQPRGSVRLESLAKICKAGAPRVHPPGWLFPLCGLNRSLRFAKLALGRLTR
jgi:hypothetical protein